MQVPTAHYPIRGKISVFVGPDEGERNIKCGPPSFGGM